MGEVLTREDLTRRAAEPRIVARLQQYGVHLDTDDDGRINVPFIDLAGLARLKREAPELYELAIRLILTDCDDE